MDVYLVQAAGGEARRIADGYGDARSLAWSPDGRRLAWSSSEGRKAGIWVLDVGSEQQPRRLSGARGLFLAWSPDARRLAVIDAGSGIEDRRIGTVDL